MGYSLQHAAPCIRCISTAGFSCASDTSESRYVATSLHGWIDARKQVGSGQSEKVVLADVFRTDDEKFTGANEVGHVVGDWRNDYIDVALVQVPDEQKSAAVWYTQAEVISYMVDLMKATYDINWSPVRVIVHSPPCFSHADTSGIFGTLSRIWHIGERDSKTHCWHITVRLDANQNVLPGQSGSAVTLVDGSRPIRMLVGRLGSSLSTAVVTPLHHIYASLNEGPLKHSRVHLFSCPDGLDTVAASEQPTKFLERGRVFYRETRKQHMLAPEPMIDGLLKACCSKHSRQVNDRLHNAFDHKQENAVPSSCQWW